MNEAAELFERYADRQSICNLPELDKLHHPTVSLHMEQFKTFRNDFLMLQFFAAAVCGVAPERLCKLDLIKYLRDIAAAQIKED